jgi:hypothetical protein
VHRGCLNGRAAWIKKKMGNNPSLLRSFSIAQTTTC